MWPAKTAAAMFLLATAGVLAAGVPAAGPDDPHIRIVPYKENDVTVVRVQRGIVTRIMLEQNEKIEVPVVGLSSDCSRDADEWCISAVTGANQIFIRPRDGAITNNMELHTSRRDYSFVFEVLPDGASRDKRLDQLPYFRVTFAYPGPKPEAPMSQGDRSFAASELLRRIGQVANRQLPQTSDIDYGMTASQRLKAEGIQVRNAKYTKQVLAKGDDADPTMVFDDGRFTYFEYLGAREIPAVFAYGSDGEPTRVNWHVQGDFLVVQRTAQKFTLRLGDAVVGVFNEAFDATGISTPTATISPAVNREIRGETR